MNPLAKEIRQQLAESLLETPMAGIFGLNSASLMNIIQHNTKESMQALGLDLDNDSLRDTPKRVAKMYVEEVFKGLNYDNFPECSTFKNDMQVDEMIVTSRIEVLSYCEHHLIPFIGHAFVAYVPKTKILGLSKFNRVVDFFARRPQVQERLTEQIHLAFRVILETDNVALVIKAQHLCVKMRGIMQPNCETTSSKMTGIFRDKPEARAEFLSLINGR